MDDIFASEEAEQTVETPEVEAGQPRDEAGRFASKTGVEPAPEPVAPVEEVQEPVPPTDKLPKEEYEALKGWRAEKQTLKSEMETLKQQLQQLQQAQPKPEPGPPPSYWENEDEARAYDRQVVLEQAALRTRIDASEMVARTQYADFQEKFDLFNQLAASNPSLVQQAMADPHPWGKAYQLVAAHQRMQELGAVDVSDLEAKLREQIKAEMAQQAQPAPAIPNSLADAQSARGTGPATGFQPYSLQDIIGR